jgi:hypothetical protein
MNVRTKFVHTLLKDLEHRYVESLNAVIAAPIDRDSDDNVNRWRGHAEAYRQVCECIRRDTGLPDVGYGSDVWRKRNGVYESGQWVRS